MSGNLKWQLRWRPLLATVAVVIVLAPLAHFWQTYQLNRNGEIFLTRAEELQQEGKWSDALPYIERYLRVFPDDIDARVRMAQVFDHMADGAASKVPTAERLYLVAVGLAPDRPELRIRHAQRLLQLDRCEDALAEAREALKLQRGNAQALRLRAVAAYGHAKSRRDFSAAEDLAGNFRAALAAYAGKPEQIELAVQLAELFRRGAKEPDEAARRTMADKVVDEMVAANAQRPAAWLARYLYHQRHDGEGSNTDLDRALELDSDAREMPVSLAAAAVDSNKLDIGPATSPPLSAAIQGLMARLLLRRGRAGDQERGKQILEELVSQEQVADDDRIVLIRIYQDQGDQHKARQQAHALVDRKKPLPGHLAQYVELLLSDGRASEAGPWLARLSEVDPDSFTTLRTRARLLASEGRKDEIEPFAEHFLKQLSNRGGSPSERMQGLIRVGELYAQMQMDPQAERAFRQLASQSSSSYQPLALWLASRGRGGEAVDLCLQAAAKDLTPQAATTLIRCLAIGKANAELAGRAEAALAAALKAHSRNSEFLLILATWRTAQQQNAEGIELLRRILEVQPRNTQALNNLADALAEQPETRAEARELIDRALAQAGPLPELLDTKGTLLLFEGDFDGAIKLFRGATARLVPDPRHLFHLALALRRAGLLPESREVFDRANKPPLDSTNLSPLQQRLLEELRQDLRS